MGDGDVITIAVDAMGGDHAPAAICAGAADALKQPGFRLLLVGREGPIRKELDNLDYDADRVDVLDAPEVILTDEPPTAAIKQKKNSSIVLALHLVRDRKADAFVSAGNTGALLTGAALILGRIAGIERPALGTLLPNATGHTFLIDSGANVDVKPAYLLQFAKMGAAYMEHTMGIKNPRVGLLNIGAEREKGNALTKEAYSLLEAGCRNFIGNVEARDIPDAAADVVVCDGFEGNILLKYSEGLAGGIMRILQRELTVSPVRKIGAWLARGAFAGLKKTFDYAEVGGAPFLGLNALVVKAHGSSNARAITAAIEQCRLFAANNIAQKIEAEMING